MEECPECGIPSNVFTNECNDRICGDCGVVLCNEYNMSADLSSVYCGGNDLACSFVRKEIVMGGKCVKNKQRYNIENKITTYCSVLNLSNVVKDSVIHFYFNKLYGRFYKRHTNLGVAVSIYICTRECDIPVAMKDLCGLSGLKDHDIVGGFAKIKRLLGIDIKAANSNLYFDMYFNMILELFRLDRGLIESRDVLYRKFCILHRCFDDNLLTSGRNPRIVTLAMILILLHRYLGLHNNAKMVYKRVACELNMGSETIRKRVTEITNVVLLVFKSKIDNDCIGVLPWANAISRRNVLDYIDDFFNYSVYLYMIDRGHRESDFGLRPNTNHIFPPSFHNSVIERNRVIEAIESQGERADKGEMGLSFYIRELLRSGIDKNLLLGWDESSIRAMYISLTSDDLENDVDDNPDRYFRSDEEVKLLNTIMGS